MAVGWALVFAAAPVYRYLLGMHLFDTRGSILAAGIQHASWNAAQNLNVVEGGDWEWQTLAAVALLTALVAIGRLRWRPEPGPWGGRPRRQQPPGGRPTALLLLDPKHEDLGSDDRLPRHT
jgi:hypothetical protein